MQILDVVEREKKIILHKLKNRCANKQVRVCGFAAGTHPAF